MPHNRTTSAKPPPGAPDARGQSDLTIYQACIETALLMSDVIESTAAPRICASTKRVRELHRDRAILKTERGATQTYRRRPVGVGRFVLALELSL